MDTGHLGSVVGHVWSVGIIHGQWGRILFDGAMYGQRGSYIASGVVHGQRGSYIAVVYKVNFYKVRVISMEYVRLTHDYVS